MSVKNGSQFQISSVKVKTDCRAFRWRSLYNVGVVSLEGPYVGVCEKRTVVCDVVLPMSKFSTKGVPKMLKREAHPEFLRHMRDDPISEECPHFRLGTVADGKNL